MDKKLKIKDSTQDKKNSEEKKVEEKTVSSPILPSNSSNKATSTEDKSVQRAEDKMEVLPSTPKSTARENLSELEERLREESKENIELLRAGSAPENSSTPESPVNPEYALQLSQKPIDKIYHEMTSLYQLAEGKGYLNSEEQRRVQYLVSAVEKKVQAAEEHRYDMTEEAAAVAGITRQMGVKLKDFYKGNREYQVEYRFE